MNELWGYVCRGIIKPAPTIDPTNLDIEILADLVACATFEAKYEVALVFFSFVHK